MKVEPIVSRLLFESVPLIGSQMRELYTKWLNYPSDLPFYLIREVEEQLSPCLIVDKKQKVSCWLFLLSYFTIKQGKTNILD